MDTIILVLCILMAGFVLIVASIEEDYSMSLLALAVVFTTKIVCDRG